MAKRIGILIRKSGQLASASSDTVELRSEPAQQEAGTTVKSL